MQSLLHSTGSQRGFIQFITVVLIALGIGLGVFLVQKQTQLLPQAATPSPSCMPRPACLDAKPACQIPEDPNMCPPSFPPLKIMPLGDSITNGVIVNLPPTDPTISGYRVYFWENSLQDGLPIDFVGSLSNGPSRLPDKEHEGHNGYRIGSPTDPSPYQVYQNIDNWLDQFRPDIILVMLGTNNLANDFDVPTALTDMSGLIDKITAKMPSSQVVIASIPPNTQAAWISLPGLFNSQLPALIQSKISQGKKVSFVDPYSVMTSADISDTVHPSESGYKKIADKFYQGVISNLPPGYSLNKPSISIAQNQISKGSSVTVGWDNVVYPFPNDFIGLYTPGSVDLHNYIDFRYTSTCSKQAGTPKASGVCDFPIDQLGQYEFRLFSQGSYLKLAASTIVDVVDAPPSSPSPLPSVSPSASPSQVPSPSPSPSVAISPSPSLSPSPSASASPSPPPSGGPKPGDIDGNGKVNIFDFSLFLSDFGKKGQNLKADFNNNGKVDIFDFSILLSNWGK